MAKNGQKWSYLDKNGHFWTPLMPNFYSKMSKNVFYMIRGPRFYGFWQFLAIFDTLGSLGGRILAKLCDFDRNLPILDHFSHISLCKPIGKNKIEKFFILRDEKFFFRDFWHPWWVKNQSWSFERGLIFFRPDMDWATVFKHMFLGSNYDFLGSKNVFSGYKNVFLRSKNVFLGSNTSV